MLLYLINYLRPDLCYVVRELAKCMDKVTKETYLEMLMVVKFVIDTKKFCLRIRPEFKVCVFCDSDWAGDSETGFVLYLMISPFCWQSKALLCHTHLKLNIWLLKKLNLRSL
jgi:hypothetical protein